jgi:hypothetical protein
MGVLLLKEHAPLKIKSKDWLALNEDNVSVWGGQLFL